MLIQNVQRLHHARSLARSNAHFKKALSRLPLGVASNFRYWGDDRTIPMWPAARGGRLFDIDDNCYVDYRLGYGPAILGYADARIDVAARAAWRSGRLCPLDDRELRGGELIARMVPAAELIRF